MMATVSVSTFSVQPVGGQSRAVTSRGFGAGRPLRWIAATRSSTDRLLNIATPPGFGLAWVPCGAVSDGAHPAIATAQTAATAQSATTGRLLTEVGAGSVTCAAMTVPNHSTRRDAQK